MVSAVRQARRDRQAEVTPAEVEASQPKNEDKEDTTTQEGGE